MLEGKGEGTLQEALSAAQTASYWVDEATMRLLVGLALLVANGLAKDWLAQGRAPMWRVSGDQVLQPTHVQSQRDFSYEAHDQ